MHFKNILLLDLHLMMNPYVVINANIMLHFCPFHQIPILLVNGEALKFWVRSKFPRDWFWACFFKACQYVTIVEKVWKRFK
jgi:hypothetical protein